MKLVSKPIDVIAGFFDCKQPIPYKIKYKDDKDQEKIIVVEKVIGIEDNHFFNAKTLLYKCQSSKGNLQYRFELTYTPDKHSWILYKI